MAQREISDATEGSRPREHTRIVNACYPGVYSLGCKLTGDADLAREIAQETFLRAASHLNQVSEPRRLRSWVFKIASNYIRDLFRRQGRWEAVEIEEEEEPDEPPRILEKTDDLRRVREALDSLPAETRTALVLHLQEGLTIREISDALDMTEHAARLKIYRGLQKVRARISGEERP